MESSRGECERRIGEIKSSVGRMCEHTLSVGRRDGEGEQWRNPHWPIPVNEQVALWTEQVVLPQND